MITPFSNFMPNKKELLIKDKHPMVSREEIFLNQVMRTIRENISNEQFDVPALAKELCLSVSQLNRRLKQVVNCSAGKLIRDIRLRVAAQMLKKDVASIGVIAAEIGYKNQAHFCRSFKRQYKCTPSEFVNRNLGGNF